MCDKVKLYLTIDVIGAELALSVTEIRRIKFLLKVFSHLTKENALATCDIEINLYFAAIMCLHNYNRVG